MEAECTACANVQFQAPYNRRTSYTRKGDRLSRKERRVWPAVHRLLEKKIGTEISFPKWFDEIAKRLFVDAILDFHNSPKLRSAGSQPGKKIMNCF